MKQLEILTGDCLDLLPTLAAESVQCCVPSAVVIFRPPKDHQRCQDYGR
jgi:hypothetical protein